MKLLVKNAGETTEVRNFAESSAAWRTLVQC